MASKILDDFQFKIDGITLIPSKGGVFEIELGDELIYSKLETGRHAEWSDVEPELRSRLN